MLHSDNAVQRSPVALVQSAGLQSRSEGYSAECQEVQTDKLSVLHID